MFFVVAKSSAIHGISHSNFQVGSNLNSKTLAQTPMIRVSFSFRTKVCENLKCFKKGKKPCNAWHDTTWHSCQKKKTSSHGLVFFPHRRCHLLWAFAWPFFRPHRGSKKHQHNWNKSANYTQIRLIFWIDLFQLKTNFRVVLFRSIWDLPRRTLHPKCVPDLFLHGLSLLQPLHSLSWNRQVGFMFNGKTMVGQRTPPRNKALLRPDSLT